MAQPMHPCLCYLIVEGDNCEEWLYLSDFFIYLFFFCEDKKGRVCGAGVMLQIAAEVRAWMYKLQVTRIAGASCPLDQPFMYPMAPKNFYHTIYMYLFRSNITRYQQDLTKTWQSSSWHVQKYTYSLELPWLYHWYMTRNIDWKQAMHAYWHGPTHASMFVLLDCWRWQLRRVAVSKWFFYLFIFFLWR